MNKSDLEEGDHGDAQYRRCRRMVKNIALASRLDKIEEERTHEEESDKGIYSK